MNETSLQPIKQEDFSLIEKIDQNFDKILAKQYFLRNNNGDLFIKKAGLFFKFNLLYGNKPKNITSEKGSIEDIQTFRNMYGLAENQPCFSAKVRIEFVDSGEIYEEEECVCSRNANTSQINNGYAMAKTRALLRLLRILTGCGFSSVEEMSYETINTENIIHNIKNAVVIEEKKEKINNSINKIETKEDYKNELKNLIKSGNFSTDEAKGLLEEMYGEGASTKDLTDKEWEHYIALCKELAIKNLNKKEGENNG